MTVSFPRFTVDRSRWGTYTDQIADGFRSAISTGFYKPGDRLPKVRDLAGRFGVSVRIVVAALARLADEQLVAKRPGIGTEVLAPRTSLWKGLVLLIIPGGDYVYRMNILAGRVNERLSNEGYFVLRVTVPIVRRDVYDFRYLELLLRQSPTLVVLLSEQCVIERYLSSKHADYIAVGSSGSAGKKCRGRIRTESAAAYAAFAAHLKRAGVRSLALVGTGRDDFPLFFRRRMQGTGVRISDWSVPTDGPESGRLDVLQTATRDDIRARLSSGCPLPDVLFFVDEYRALGGATALYGAGVRIPLDVRLVSVANVGNGPVLRTDCARIEYDPFGDGDVVSEAVVTTLRTGVFPADAVLRVHYRPGGTFPR